MASKSPPQPSSPPPLLRRITNFDKQISLHLHTLTHPILPHSFLKLLEISGDGRLFFPIIISTLLSPHFTPSLSTTLLFPFLVNLLIGSLLDLLIIGLCKHLVKRPRPIYNKNMSISFAVDHWSFPSGHSSRVCFIAGLFCLSESLVDKYLKMVGGFDRVKVVNWCVCVWAGVTSVSRVLLGRHYVFDVVVGACLGVFEAFFVFYYLNYENLASVLR